MRIHGCFLNKSTVRQNCMVYLVEMPDNQMSFQRYFFWGVEEANPFEFIGYRDVHDRDFPVSNDPIVKYRQLVDSNDYQHGVAIRKSGKVDLYYNC